MNPYDAFIGALMLLTSPIFGGGKFANWSNSITNTTQSLPSASFMESYVTAVVKPIPNTVVPIIENLAPLFIDTPPQPQLSYNILFANTPIAFTSDIPSPYWQTHPTHDTSHRSDTALSSPLLVLDVVTLALGLLSLVLLIPSFLVARRYLINYFKWLHHGAHTRSFREQRLSNDKEIKMLTFDHVIDKSQLRNANLDEIKVIDQAPAANVTERYRRYENDITWKQDLLADHAERVNAEVDRDINWAYFPQYLKEIERYKSILQSRGATIQDKKTAIGLYKERISALESTLKRRDNKIDGLEGKLSLAKASGHHAKTEYQTLKRDAERIQKDLVESWASVSSLKQKLHTATSELESTKKKNIELEGKAESRKVALQENKSTIEGLKRDRDDWKKYWESECMEKQKLELKMESLQVKKESPNAEFKQLQDSLTEASIGWELATAEIGDKNDQIKELEDEVRTFDTTLEQRDATIKQQRAAIKERDTTIKERDGTIKARDGTIKEQGASMKQQDTTIKAHDASIKQRDATIKARDMTVKEQAATIKELEEELIEAERCLNSSEKEKNLPQSRSNAQESSDKVHQGGSDKDDKTLKKLNDRIEKHLQSIDRLQQENMGQQTTITGLKKDLEKGYKEKEGLKKDLEKESKEKEALKKMVEDLRQEIDDLQETSYEESKEDGKNRDQLEAYIAALHDQLTAADITPALASTFGIFRPGNKFGTGQPGAGTTPSTTTTAPTPTTDGQEASTPVNTTTATPSNNSSSSAVNMAENGQTTTTAPATTAATAITTLATPTSGNTPSHASEAPPMAMPSPSAAPTKGSSSETGNKPENNQTVDGTKTSTTTSSNAPARDSRAAPTAAKSSGAAPISGSSTEVVDKAENNQAGDGIKTPTTTSSNKPSGNGQTAPAALTPPGAAPPSGSSTSGVDKAENSHTDKDGKTGKGKLQLFVKGGKY